MRIGSGITVFFLGVCVLAVNGANAFFPQHVPCEQRCLFTADVLAFTLAFLIEKRDKNSENK